MIALRHCSAFLGRIVAVGILALPTPSVLAHLLDAALGLPAKFLERQRRICPALANIARATRLDLVGNAALGSLLERLDDLNTLKTP